MNPLSQPIISQAYVFNGTTPDTLNAQIRMVDEYVGNIMSTRSEFLQQLINPRRDINKECGYPSTHEMSPQKYQDLYDRGAIPARVVEVMPKEAWQLPPDIFETEEDVETPFEFDVDALPQMLRGESSYYKGEEGNPIWKYLMRVDILSGIAQYGALLFGINDGAPLDQPAKGVEIKNSLPVDSQKQGETEDDFKKRITINLNRPIQPYSLTINAKKIREGLEAAGKANPTPTSKPIPEDDDEGDETTPGSEEPEAETEADTSDEAVGKGGGDLSSTSGSALVSGAPKRKLMYLRVFSQAQAMVTQWECNRTSPRFGQPTMYQLTFNDYRENIGAIGAPMATLNVHWTRVLHVPSPILGSSDVVGKSLLQQPLNHLLNLEKIYSSDGEGYWQNSFPKLALETHPQLGGDVRVNRTEIRSMLQSVRDGVQREMILMGMSAKTLPPSVVDPTPHINANIEAICILRGIPIPVFKGYEIGEQASENNDDNWNSRVAHYQNTRCTPDIIIPFFERLIMLGCLRPPSQEVGWQAKWPDLSAASDAETAQVGLTRIQGVVAYIGGNGSALIGEKDFLTKYQGWSDDEADAILENKEKELEEKLNEQIEAGMVPMPGANPNDPTKYGDPEMIDKQLEADAAAAKNPFGGGKGKPPSGGKGFPPKGPPGKSPTGKPPMGKPPFLK